MKNEKEVYRLWIEYLKRSKNYKEFCEWFRKKRKNKKLPVPEKFKKPKYPSNYSVFGPIHDSKWTFEKWWKGQKQRLTSYDGLPVETHITRKILKVQKKWKPRGIVEDYSNLLREDMDICIRKFKFYHENREPTLNEFVKYFVCELNGGVLSQYITIRIDLYSESIDKQVMKFIKKQKELPKVKERELQSKRYLKPSPNYITEELEYYLDIYDLRKQGLKPKEIIVEFNKKHNLHDDPKDLDVQRKFREYRIKANKIIEFVEMGIFPGPYDKTTLRRKKRKAKNR